MSVACKITMKNKVRPVKGSATGTERNRTGTCPKCQTPGVMLSIVGEYIRAHEIASVPIPKNNPQPVMTVAEKREHPHAGKKVSSGLSEPVTLLTDTGVRIGNPREAERVRAAEINGAAGTGSVKVPRKVDSGKKLKSGLPRMVSKLVEVEATEAHVREALDYWRGRKITERTSDAVRKRQVEMVSLLSRQLEAIVSAQVVRCSEDGTSYEILTLPVAAQEPLRARTDTAQAHRGPTLVRGRDTTPRTREAAPAADAGEAAVLRDPHATTLEPTDLRQVTVGPKGARTVVGEEPRRHSTLDQPLGRERFDKRITDVPEPPKRRTPAERNRYRKAQRLARKLAGASES